MYATHTFTASASQGPYAFPFPYLDENHIDVEVDGTSVGVSVSVSGQQLTFVTPTLAGGETIVVRRDSSPSAALVTFQNGGVAADDLNTSALQALYLSQEILDAVAGGAGDYLPSSVSGGLHWESGGLRLEGLAAPQAGSHATTKTYVDAAIAAVALTAGLPLSGAVWDAQSKKISNVLTPASGNDATNKTYVDAAVLAASGLPPVTGGDNGSILMVVAGAWDVTIPGDARTGLGLGTAAVRNTGAGVGAVPLIQDVGGGTAGFAAIDGRNLTNVPAVGRAEAVLRLQTNTLGSTGSIGATWYNDGSGLTYRLDLAATVAATDTANNGNSDIVVDAANNIVTLTKSGTYRVRIHHSVATAGTANFRYAFSKSDGTGTAVLLDTFTGFTGELSVESVAYLVVPSVTSYAWYGVRGTTAVTMASLGSQVLTIEKVA